MHTPYTSARATLNPQMAYVELVKRLWKHDAPLRQNIQTTRNNPSTNPGDTQGKRWGETAEIRRVRKCAQVARNNNCPIRKGNIHYCVNSCTMCLFIVMRISMGNIEGGDIILKQLNSCTKLNTLSMQWEPSLSATRFNSMLRFSQQCSMRQGKWSQYPGRQVDLWWLWHF